MQVVRFSRNGHDLLKWITRLEINLKRLRDSWNDLFVPVTAVNDSRIACLLGTVPQNIAQQLMTDPDLAMEELNKEAFAHHQRSFPLS